MQEDSPLKSIATKCTKCGSTILVPGSCEKCRSKEKVRWVVTRGNSMVGIFKTSKEAIDYVDEARGKEGWMTLDYWPGEHKVGSLWVVKGVHEL